MSWAAVVALAVGALVFAVPLERSSKLTRVEGKFVTQRSKAFLVLRACVEQFVSPLQTGALFFLLAFGAIARWRVGLVLEYRRLSTTPG
ncbi:MAG: CcdC protein domain-containing protein [Myxococcota bacterium]